MREQMDLVTARIAVLDLETTGLDEKSGAIIEVGCVMVDGHLDPLDTFESLAYPVVDADPELWHPKVAEMHRASGLLEACLDYDNPSIFQVDLRLATWLLRLGGDEQVKLAGSGVSHFDSRWLAYWMPHTRALLSHWTYDVGVVRRFAVDIVGLDNPHDVTADKPHRALADAWLHLEEMRAWRDLLSERGVA